MKQYANGYSAKWGDSAPRRLRNNPSVRMTVRSRQVARLANLHVMLLTFLVGLAGGYGFPSPFISEASAQVPPGELIFDDSFEGQPLNQAPSLNAIGPQSVDLGSSLTVNLGGSDPEDDPLMFGVFPSPSNASLDAVTGNFVFSPDAVQVGVIEVTFTVSDGNLHDNEVVEITINGAPAEGITILSGRVLDTTDYVFDGTETGVEGAVVSIQGSGISALTSADGSFVLDAIPDGEQVFSIDPTGVIGPENSSYAGFREALHIIANVDNQVTRPFFLPRIDTDSLTTIDPATTTLVVNPNINVTLEVIAGSAEMEGVPFAGQLSISEVPGGLAPAALPPELDPGLLITIQPVGVTFDPPIPITFPNIDGLTPGSETDIWSLDPESGTFIVVGIGQVSNDGTVIETISGGVIAADWHMTLPPGSEGQANNNGDNDNRKKCCDQETGSSTAVASGNLTEVHRLASYHSLSRERALTLTYSSKNANPRPIVGTNPTIVVRAAVPPVLSSHLSISGVDTGISLYTNTSGLSENFDETFRHRLRFDANALPTGRYTYRIMQTSHYPASNVSSFTGGNVIVNNLSSSEFGAGWSLSGLSRLHFLQNGSLLLTEGDGSALSFKPGLTEKDGLFMQMFDVPGEEAELATAVSSGFVGLAPGLFDVTTATEFLTADSFIVPVVNFPDIADNTFDTLAFYNVGPDGAIEPGSTTFVPLGDDTSIQPPGNNDYFGTSFTGFVRLPNGGDITFGIGWDDMFDLIIDGTSVLSTFSGDDFRFFEVTVPGLPSGVVPITVNFGEVLGEANIVLSASGGGLPGGVIPQEFLQTAPSNIPGLAFEAPDGDFSTLVKNNDDSFTRRLKNGTEINFDADGLQTSIVDRNGNTTTYQYDSSDRLILIADPVGLETTLTYSDGRLATITDPQGRTTYFIQDSHGNLKTILDPDGSGRSFDYDSSHNLVAQTSKRGFVTNYEYDFTGRNTKVTKPDMSTNLIMPSDTVGLFDPGPGVGTADNPAPIVRAEEAIASFTDGNGNTTSYRTGPFGASTETTDALGRTTTVTRDSDGNPTQIISPNGAVSIMTYDSRGNLLELVQADGTSLQREIILEYEPEFNQPVLLVDPAGYSTSMEYDANGDLTRQVDQLLGEQLFTYNMKGQPLTVTDPNTNLTEITYDAMGNKASVTDALLNLTNIQSDNAGRITQVTGGVGTAQEQITITVWDVMNRLTSIVDEVGAESLFRYHPDGLLLERETPTGEITTYTYDSRNRLTSVLDPVSGLTTDGYDQNDNLVSTTNDLNKATTFHYNAANQLVQQVDAIGGAEILEYDVQGNVVAITDVRSNETTFEYDLLDRLIVQINSLGQAVSFEYSPMDLLISMTDARGNVTTHVYDELSRLLETTTPDNQTTYTYDPANNRLTVEDNDSSLQFTYDALNRIEMVNTLVAGVQPVTSLTYTYDAAGNRVQLNDSEGGVTQFEYDGADRLTQVTTPTLDVIIQERDLSGKLIKIINPNGILSDYNYDVLGRLEGISHSDTPGPILENLNYTYDGIGNITSLTDLTDARNFAYDPLQRLTAAGTAIQPEDYTYDAVGNRISSHISTTHVTNEANRLLQDDDFIYTYDLDGNLADKTAQSNSEVTTFTFNANSQLVQITFPDATTATYRYDGLGRRIEKNVDGVISRYVYDGLDLILEFDDAVNLMARYTHGSGIDQPLSMERGGQSYYYHADHLGSIRMLTDASGIEVSSYSYDAYGRLEIILESVPNPFAYTGREYDEESGLYYYRARYYDPNSGRFIAEDPLGYISGSFNFYAYTSNNPVNSIDPSGLLDGWVIAQGVTDFLKGAGDTISFGLTEQIRERLWSKEALGGLLFGRDVSTIHNCGAYKAGEVTATVVELAAGGYGVYKGGTKLAARAALRDQKRMIGAMKAQVKVLEKRLEKEITSTLPKAMQQADNAMILPATQTLNDFRNAVKTLEYLKSVKFIR